ncbi:acyl carrier protein [Devosia naphthalenivorans]|uniref:acyl carrier protein n=1 Tax=Devosia naphthalenivorans TaxID=2082392 RepID=UPI000D3BBD40|nr:acyl carrier protein [Devosia naphthalenivorans]
MSDVVLESMKDIVAETLGLGARRDTLTENTALLGQMPELDSLAVVELAMAIEKRFGITIADNDFGSELFESMGSLVAYVEQSTSAVAAE